LKFNFGQQNKNMDTNISEVEINGVKYVRKDSVCNAPKMDSENVVIVRCETAGVFFGELAESDLANGVVKLTNARRLWYWSGAASLSQLAVDGTAKPKECKFPVAVPEISLAKVIEVIPCTEKAVASINGVAIWKA
jgi:hypothetical protein